MYLKKKRLGEEGKIRVTFEKVMDDLLLISIDKQQREAALLCYWRLTDVAGIPPLQIGIDCESGSLDSITFFVDKTHMLTQGPLNAAAKRGSVLLDASIFSRANQYVDVERGYAVQVGKDLMLCLFDGEEKSRSSYQTDRLRVFLSREEEVVGFALCDLTREEMSMLQSLYAAR